jgi:Plavaka transposase
MNPDPHERNIILVVLFIVSRSHISLSYTVITPLMPRSRRSINPSFGVDIVQCRFCQYTGSRSNLLKHISQKKSCCDRYTQATHQVQQDVGVIDQNYYCQGAVAGRVSNSDHSSAVPPGRPSPRKAKHDMAAQRSEDQNQEDDSFSLPDFDDGDMSYKSNAHAFTFTTYAISPRLPNGEIEMISFRRYRASDDLSIQSMPSQPEFPLQLEIVNNAVDTEMDVGTSIQFLHSMSEEYQNTTTQLNECVSKGQFSEILILPAEDAGLKVALCSQDRVYLKLLQLTEHGALPYYYVGLILEWAKEASQLGFNFQAIIHERNTLVRQFNASFPNLPKCSTVDVQLESVYQTHNRETARVVLWDLTDVMQNLLYDLEIFGEPNNIMHNQSPDRWFYPYVTLPDDFIDEAITGEWYSNTIEWLTKNKNFDPKSDIHVPLIGCCDGTHIDHGGRHKLCPLMVTTSLIKSNIRNHPRAWRHLGLVPDLQKMSKAAAKLSRQTPLGLGRPIRNYHACLSAILHSAKTAMEHPVSMCFRIGNQVQVKRCFFTFQMFNLDAQEKDKWVGRYSSHHPSLNTAAYRCLTPIRHCNNLGRRCKPLNQYSLQHLSWTATHTKNTKHRDEALEQL